MARVQLIIYPEQKGENMKFKTNITKSYSTLLKPNFIFYIAVIKTATFHIIGAYGKNVLYPPNPEPLGVKYIRLPGRNLS